MIDVAVVALIVVAAGVSFAFGFLAGVEQTRRAARETFAAMLADDNDPLVRVIVAALVDRHRTGVDSGHG